MAPFRAPYRGAAPYRARAQSPRRNRFGRTAPRRPPPVVAVTRRTARRLTRGDQRGLRAAGGPGIPDQPREGGTGGGRGCPTVGAGALTHGHTTGEVRPHAQYARCLALSSPALGSGAPPCAPFLACGGI